MTNSNEAITKAPNPTHDLAEIISKEDFENALFQSAIKLYNKKKVREQMKKAKRWGRKSNFGKPWMIGIGKTVLDARDNKKLKYREIKELIEADHDKSYSIPRIAEIYKHYKDKE